MPKYANTKPVRSVTKMQHCRNPLPHRSHDNMRESSDKNLRTSHFLIRTAHTAQINEESEGILKLRTTTSTTADETGASQSNRDPPPNNRDWLKFRQRAAIYVPNNTTARRFLRLVRMNHLAPALESYDLIESKKQVPDSFGNGLPLDRIFTSNHRSPARDSRKGGHCDTNLPLQSHRQCVQEISRSAINTVKQHAASRHTSNSKNH